MSIRIKGGGSANLLTIDSSGFTNSTMPLDLDIAGYANFANNDSRGNGQTARGYDTSQDYRLSIGFDKVLWDDTFEHSVADTSHYTVTTSGHVVGPSSTLKTLALNSGSSIFPNGYSRFQTVRTFVLSAAYPTYVDMHVILDMTMTSAHGVEFGLGFPSTSLTAPTDGIFFRSTGSTLYSVLNYNSTETVQELSFDFTSGITHHFSLVLNENSVEFWADNILLSIMSHTSTIGGISKSMSLPLMFKNYNIGIPATGLQFGLKTALVSIGDVRTNKGSSHTSVSRGLSSVSETPARTPAQTANYANSSTASTITLSNSSVGYTNLGGQFQFLVPTSGETDYAVFGYFSSSATASTVNRNLYITDIRVDTYNSGAANAGSPVLMQWAIAVGSTAESLATTDSATSGTRGPRRMFLGTQMIAASAVVGASADRSLDVNLKSPLLVEPGTYVHLILKVPVSIPTNGQFIKGYVRLNGYFE